MKKLILILIFLCIPQIALAQTNRDRILESITVEGAPIWTKHFQSEDENFKESHFLGVIKAHTNGYGNWGLYFLGPNSVDKTSVGFGYVTDAYAIPMGMTRLEFSGALGLVTGYQDFPVPLLAGQVRWNLYQKENWDFGISSAIMPYYANDEFSDRAGDGDFGLVVTTPFLSAGYNF